MCEVKGIIISKGETIEYGTNGFKKREFVVETDEQYPQKVKLELVKDKCALLDKFGIGSVVTCNINVNGREWIDPDGKEKYFNSLVAWKIEGEAASSGPL
jgi:hypothetical protein